ncbi:TPA: hypothetical protein QDC20_004111 [Burkholderia aenigmatica]|uniref:hypothetical protein n=1 Tax=unclassified Burkholderia TaxID=2613784 RepID=UPI0016420B8C|nr:MULTISPECIES: hypothetical protein [unclassified Burkholderia]HDR9611569.1 hypothetical protein [Burkholderia aenigmatica]MDN7520223.1 hypothetical protein [Burkholderia sp. AU45251]HDR9620779.1 hypothetical protein [Burkholderia aenigmatica]HDR9675091.1 hypothetical protein [Burkholderia aenigmatica]HDR9691732.1 hypothetical protein [Burkholderia aenigmatica]
MFAKPRHAMGQQNRKGVRETFVPFKFEGVSFRAVWIALAVMLAACSRHDTPVNYSPAGQFTSLTVPGLPLPSAGDVNTAPHAIKEDAQGQQTKGDSAFLILGLNTYLTVVRSPDDLRGFRTANYGTAQLPPDINPGPDDLLLVISHQSFLDRGYADTVRTVPDAPGGSDSLTLSIESSEDRTPGMMPTTGVINNNVFVIKRGKASKVIVTFGDLQKTYDLGPAVR